MPPLAKKIPDPWNKTSSWQRNILLFKPNTFIHGYSMQLAAPDVVFQIALVLSYLKVRNIRTFGMF